MRYLRAPWRVVKMILGLNLGPFEPTVISPEVHLLRLAKALEELEAATRAVLSANPPEGSLDEWAARRPRER